MEIEQVGQGQEQGQVSQVDEAKAKVKGDRRIYTDRSRVLEYHKCPRKRYLAYHYGGRGISRTAANVPLTTGIYTHVGLSLLMSGQGIETAVEQATKGYMAEVQRRGLELDYLSDSHEFTLIEQVSLTEAMLRAYHAAVLPGILADFTVVEVETEDVLKLAQTEDFELYWQARTDALLMENCSGDLYVESFKTAATWDRRNEAAANHDMQGLSEPAAVTNRLSATDGPRALADWESHRQSEFGTTDPNIMGVKMEWLVKGRRDEYPRGSGRRISSSPLIYGYRLRGLNPDQDQYSWKYVSRKGWEKFNVWEAKDIGGIKGWIEMLRSGVVEPYDENCLAAQFVLPPPFLRHQRDMERWQRTVTTQELEVAAKLAYVEGEIATRESDEWIDAVLDYHFRMHTAECDFPYACEYIPICHGTSYGTTLGAADGLIKDGWYEWRRPHHKPEMEQFVELYGAAGSKSEGKVLA